MGTVQHQDLGVTLFPMPTTRPRYTLTETPELARALDAAGSAWPELGNDRAALLRRLVETGYHAVVQRSDERLTSRRLALRRGSGVATGAYPADAAEALKSEWPE
jgi:hypothetical protein